MKEYTENSSDAEHKKLFENFAKPNKSKFKEDEAAVYIFQLKDMVLNRQDDKFSHMVITK